MIEPQAFLDEAVRILGREPTREIASRTVISRAYYACYHQALAYAQRQGYGSGFQATGGVHKRLRQFLRQHWAQDPDATDLLRDLEHLFHIRIRADYRLDRDVYVADAVDAVETATDVMTALADKKP
jgi:uncharacterized protein (UPF0332 family)